MCSIKHWHFRWSWVTFKGHFGDLLTFVTSCAQLTFDLLVTCGVSSSLNTWVEYSQTVTISSWQSATGKFNVVSHIIDKGVQTRKSFKKSNTTQQSWLKLPDIQRKCLPQGLCPYNQTQDWRWIDDQKHPITVTHTHTHTSAIANDLSS